MDELWLVTNRALPQVVEELLHHLRLWLGLGWIQAVGVEGGHRGNNLGTMGVIAHWMHPRHQPEWVASLASLCGLAGSLGVAILIHLELKEPLADGCMLHHGEVVLSARMEPHDVCSVPKIPGRPPLLV